VKIKEKKELTRLTMHFCTVMHIHKSAIRKWLQSCMVVRPCQSTLKNYLFMNCNDFWRYFFWLGSFGPCLGFMLGSLKTY